MLKCYILFSFLCALTHAKLNLEKPNFVQTKDLNTSRAVTFPFANNIATASKNSSHLQLNVIKYDSESVVAKCAVPLTTLKNEIIGSLNAATSDDSVIIWGETTTDKDEKVKRKRFGGIIIKPWKNCEATATEVGSYRLPEDYMPLEPVVLFDKGNSKIFHPRQQDCPTCQFHEEDYSVPIHGAIDGKPSKNFLIKVIRLPSGDDGYFYAYNYENDTAVIIYLDANRVVLKEKYVDYPVDVADPVRNQPLVNVCSEKSFLEVFCGQLDDKLEFRFKERLPLLGERIVMSLTLSSGSKGELLIGTLQAVVEKPQKYVVYSYDTDGKMVKAMDFGELEENKIGDLEIYVHSWHRDDAGHYCLHMHEREFLSELDAREVIKCIDSK